MELLELYTKSHTHKVVSADKHSNMVNHSYLIVSNDTFLVKEYALFVASELLCNESNAPCGVCKTCTRIMHGNHSDVIVYPKDKDTIMTEDVNSIVLDECVLPYEGDKKVYILYNFDNATVQAQNKLLKTLEEPNKSTIFVLTASNIDNVLPTIRSRSKKIIEGMLDDATIHKYLIDNGVEDSIAKIVARKSFGNLTYALGHANSLAGKQIISLASDIFNNMINSSMVLEYSNKIVAHKDDIKDLISQMMICVSDMAKLIASGKQSSEYNLKLYNLNSLNEIAKLCEQAQRKVDANCNINSVADGLLLGILEVRYKWQG